MAHKPHRLINPFLTIGGMDLTCFASGIHILGDEDDSLATFCDPLGYAWALSVDFKLSYGANSLDTALSQLGGPGSVLPFVYSPGPGAATEENPHFSGTIRLTAWPVVDAELNSPTEFTMEMPIIGDIVRDPVIDPLRSIARPGFLYAADADITAEDATNAGELTTEGFTANPTTAWTTGQYITIGTFKFHWTGAAWAEGSA